MGQQFGRTCCNEYQRDSGSNLLRSCFEHYRYYWLVGSIGDVEGPSADSVKWRGSHYVHKHITYKLPFCIMIVCICKGVSDSTIRELLNHIDIAKVKQVTGASTQCGTCNMLLDQIASKVKDDK